MKKIALWLLCLTLALALAGCAKITGNNSFQNSASTDAATATQSVAQTQPEQTAAAEPQPVATDAPNTDPNAAGFNG